MRLCPGAKRPTGFVRLIRRCGCFERAQHTFGIPIHSFAGVAAHNLRRGFQRTHWLVGVDDEMHRRMNRKWCHVLLKTGLAAKSSCEGLSGGYETLIGAI